MPYIRQEERELLKSGGAPCNAGQLNYCLTELIMEYVDTSSFCYQTLNDVIGALEGAKAEFYRRVVAPYEDQKRALNGDVYGGGSE